jgi:hypothetical protein
MLADEAVEHPSSASALFFEVSAALPFERRTTPTWVTGARTTVVQSTEPSPWGH